MKRDMDLIRRIVLAMEEQEAKRGDWFTRSTRLEGVDRNELKEHILLAHEAGLINVRLSEALGGRWGVQPGARLTNLGHDFAESLRSNEQMKTAIDWIKKAGRAVTIDLLLAWVMRQIGE